MWSTQPPSQTTSPFVLRRFLAKGGILVWVIFATFSDLFSQFLNFSIPLVIIGLVTPAIADLGRGAGKWLGITTAIAYGSTLFSGFLTYLVCVTAFPSLLGGYS